MPNWLFILVLVAVFASLYFLPFRFMRVLHILDTPDRALAYFGVFLGLQLLVQQTTGLTRGFVYMASVETVRRTIDASGKLNLVFSGWGVPVHVVYWLLAAGVLASVAALIRGTVRDARHRNDGDAPATRAEVQEVTRKLERILEVLEGRGR